MSVNVLVTGANGQLGKTIKDVCSNSYDHVIFTFVTRQQLDISDQKAVAAYFKANAFDYCINCAAYTNVEQAEESIEDAFRINADAVGFLAEECKNVNCVLVHISTDYVFDGTKETPYLENDLTHPINQYGASKLAGEEKIKVALEEYFIIRTSWLYSKYPKNFVTTIATKIAEDSDLTITTSQKGTPTSCVELAKFVCYLIGNVSKKYGIYHFSSNGSATWYDFALKIANHFPNYDQHKITKTETFKSKAERPSFSVMDNSKVQTFYKDQNDWITDLDSVMKNYLNKSDS